MHTKLVVLVPRSLQGTARYVLFGASAALAALAVKQAVHEPVTGLVAFALAALVMAPSWWGRRRLERALRSGDVRVVLATWAEGLAKLPHPETMAPLVTASAFAACGWIEQARTALSRAVKGPAWEAALEHRLFVETLLDAYEGDRDAALAKAERLAQMPVPIAGPVLQHRVRTLRAAMCAFARAFAHDSAPGDIELLTAGAAKSPLMHWPLRYAAAVVAIDRGEPERVKLLLEGAPTWPEASAFRLFQAEIDAAIAAPPADAAAH